MQSYLKESDAFSYYIHEQISTSDSSTLLYKTIQEEELFRKEFGSSQITYLRQAFMSLRNAENKPLLALIYTPEDSELSSKNQEYPTVWLLTTHPERFKQVESIYHQNVTIAAKTRQIPATIQQKLNVNTAVAIPMSMAGGILRGGFSTHIIGKFESTDEVEKFSTLTESYYDAENRRTRNFSSLALLKKLKSLDSLQLHLRLGIVLTCGMILAVIIGTIAWLEYRQESYLFALLCSFGTSKLTLLFHAFFENMILVLLGLAATLTTWPHLYDILVDALKINDLQYAHHISLPPSDLSILFAFSFIGVLLAMIPVALGLRKPAGLILQ